MGINIDEIDQTKITLITIYNTYSFVYWWPILKVLPIPLANNLMMITKNMRFSKKGPWSVFYQKHAQGLVITLGKTGYCTGST